MRRGPRLFAYVSIYFNDRLPYFKVIISGFLSAVYLTCIMATTGLSLFATVLVLHLHHKSHKTPVPSFLSRLLLLKTKSFHEDEHRVEKAEKGKRNILLVKCRHIHGFWFFYLRKNKHFRVILSNSRLRLRETDGNHAGRVRKQFYNGCPKHEQIFSHTQPLEKCLWISQKRVLFL